MQKCIVSLSLCLIFITCSKKKESIKPTKSDITESVYSSGIVKSKNQYSVYPHVNGIIESILVSSGEEVEKGQALFLLYNESQKINKQNAILNKEFSDIKFNQGKLKDAKISVENALTKLVNDSVLYYKQLLLWKDQIGTKLELDQKELAYKNARNNYQSTNIKYADLKRQLEFSSEQSRKNLLLSNILEQDYIIRSEISGKIYSISKEKGEMVSVQTPIAIIGDASEFLLEMQVDEVDITKIVLGQKIVLSFDSYPNKSFEAKVSKIIPIMNPNTKSFVVEGVFVNTPPKIYPNNNFEANIVIQSKQNALIIPRAYVTNDGYVEKMNGEKVKIGTGLKDYEKMEVLSGITENDEIVKP